MTSVDAEAIDELAAAIAALVPGEVPAPAVAIYPRAVRQVGIGGFVGLHHEPEGDIVGRRVDATVSVVVEAEDADALTDAVAAVNRALVAPDRAALRSSGVLKLALADVGPESGSTAGGNLRQTMTYTVLFEFLKEPEESAGIIEKITLDVTTT